MDAESSSHSPAAGTSSSTTASGSIPSTALASIDDVIALATYCGGDAVKVAQILHPAIQKLCLSQQGEGASALLGPSSSGQDPLQVLIPHQHSLAYLHILTGRTRLALAENSITKELLNIVDSFVHGFHLEQVILAGQKMTELAQFLCAFENNTSADRQWVFHTMRSLFERFVGDNRQNLTTLHVLLVSLCLRTGQVKCAYEIVRYGLLDADRNVTPLRAVDVIEYFFCAGEVAIEAVDWVLAEQMYEACVTAPAFSAHPRQILAAKKRILVQLVLHGKMAPLPAFTSSSVARAISRQAQHYIDFAQKYASSNRAITDVELKSHLTSTSDFESDQTLSILHFSIDQHRIRRIQRLGEIFKRLTIKDVVNVLGLGSAVGPDGTNRVEGQVAAEIQNLITTGRLRAKLSNSPSSPVLTFFEAVMPNRRDEFADLASVEALNKQMADLAYWNAQLQSKEREISASGIFVRRMQSGAAFVRGSPAGGIMAGSAGSGGRGGFIQLEAAMASGGVISETTPATLKATGAMDGGLDDDYNDNVFT